MYTWEEPKQKPYAMYIHGFASSPKSGTRASLARALPEYEWLAPEVSHEPFESLEILNEWARTFEPELIVGTSMGRPPLQRQCCERDCEDTKRNLTQYGNTIRQL